MKKPKREADVRVVALGALLVLFVGFYFIGQGIWKAMRDDAAEEEGYSGKKSEDATISLELFQEKLRRQESLTVIDIRPSEAFAREHIPHSLSYPGGAIATYTPESNAPLVIVGSAEDRASSEIAKNILESRAYSYSFLEGGFEAWKAANRQTLSAGDPTSFVDQSKVTLIAAEEAKALIDAKDSNLFILDVQTPGKFAEKHVKGAVNIPLAELEKRSKEIPPARQIIVYGENEIQSFQGGVRLFDLNVFAVRTLKGNANLTSASGLVLEP